MLGDRDHHARGLAGVGWGLSERTRSSHASSSTQDSGRRGAKVRGSHGLLDQLAQLLGREGRTRDLAGTLSHHHDQGVLAPDGGEAIFAGVASGGEGVAAQRIVKLANQSSWRVFSGAMASSSGTILANEFRLLRPLGYGGAATTFLAEQVSTGQKCAVKTLPADFAKDETARMRFIREPRLLVRMPSDDVAQVIRIGAIEEEQPLWFAMELLEGETLDQRLAREDYLEPGETISILEHVCRGLDIAHRRDIIHCDIKPSNMFLARSADGHSRAKVLDFGVARWRQEPEDVFHGFTAIGTPPWMAPEQWRSRHEVSPATDVWALGLLAFEMLTGKQYWRGNSLAELWAESTIGSFDKASERAQELGVHSALPRGFDEWFSGCVTAESSHRFPSAGASLLALRSLLPISRIKSVWSLSLHHAALGDVPLSAFSALVARLRSLSGDTELAVRRVVPGSVVLILEGSQDGYTVIRSLAEEGKLGNVLGLPVLGVQWRGGPSPDDHLKAGELGSSVSGLQAFVSYAHKDEHLCDEFLMHLSMMRRQGILREWYDRCIVPGTDWTKEMHRNLEDSHVFVPLVSADFIASDYCFEVEMRRAIEKHNQGDARVIPVIVRACDWAHPPLVALQPLPQGARPVTSWSNRDEAWNDVTHGIRKAVESMLRR